MKKSILSLIIIIPFTLKAQMRPAMQIDRSNTETLSAESLEANPKKKTSNFRLYEDREKLQAALQGSKKKWDDYMQEMSKMSQEYQTINKAEIRKKINAIFEEKNAVYESFIKHNPGSLVSIEALKELGGIAPDYAKVLPLFNSLNVDVKSSTVGQEYKQELDKYKLLAVEAIAPPFMLNDKDGKAVSLSDLKGKYTLLEFWASWCGPCRAENPNVLKTYEKYHNSGLEVLYVSIDKVKDDWLKAIGEDKLPWQQLASFDREDVISLYQVKFVPLNFLLNPEGKIIAKNIHAEELNKKLSEVLK